MKHLTMQSNIWENKDELDYANLLYKKNYLLGPKNCICGNKRFMIYKDSTNKTSFSVEIINSARNIKFV